MASPAPKHCLIVDGSAVIRTVARRILENMGLRISEAEDGEQALAACRAEMPDLVLLDASMPAMDGYDVLKALRRSPDGTLPKVVFCATEYDVALVVRARHAGGDEYLLKPFDEGLMAAKIQEVGFA